MRIVPVACLEDNYAYLVIAKDGQAVVVDASEASPVREALRREGATLTAIWSTHHHWDHVGGNEELARELGVEVVGHATDRGRLPGMSRAVHDGELLRARGGLAARCIHVPGHTLGAIAYFMEDREGGHRAVFTGDTLFCAGCGRLFEGTAAQMHASLARLLELPGDTAMYCGHEYTVSNLRFAARVEPHNEDIVMARDRAAGLRAAGEPTVGATLDFERRLNPFLRVDSAELRQMLGVPAHADDAVAFAAVRAARDSFR